MADEVDDPKRSRGFAFACPRAWRDEMKISFISDQQVEDGKSFNRITVTTTDAVDDEYVLHEIWDTISKFGYEIDPACWDCANGFANFVEGPELVVTHPEPVR